MQTIWAPFSALRSSFFCSALRLKKELHSGRGADSGNQSCQGLKPWQGYFKIYLWKNILRFSFYCLWQFLSLKSKQIDGIVTTKIVSEMAAAANPEFVIADKVKIDDSSLNSPGSAVALRKNSAALQAQISSTIKRLIDSGQMQKYVEDASKLAGTSQIKK